MSRKAHRNKSNNGPRRLMPHEDQRVGVNLKNSHDIGLFATELKQHQILGLAETHFAPGFSYKV